MRILYFRDIFMGIYTTLPVEGVRQNESGIVNQDNVEEFNTYWITYAKRGNCVMYFDSFGNLRPPKKLER